MRSRVLVLSLCVVMVISCIGCKDIAGNIKARFGKLTERISTVSPAGKFGSTAEEKAMVNAVTEKYGDLQQSGDPRILELMVSSSVVNHIPADRVSQFSSNAKKLHAWFIYDNFNEGTVSVEWLYLDDNYSIGTSKDKAGKDFGRGAFILEAPDDGWPLGKYRVKVSGQGVTGQVDFQVIQGNTVSTAILLPDGSVDLAGSGSPSGSSVAGKIPVITPVYSAPTDFKLPGKTTEASVSAKNGGELRKDGIIITVPPGAVSSDCKITLVEFTQPPPNPAPSDGATQNQVECISKVYDLGPEGIKFNKPVQVTIPYEKALVGSNVDSGKIAVVYYTGKEWMAAGGAVDTEKGTVTIALTEFPGLALEIGLATIILKTGEVIAKKTYGLYKADPVAWKNASEYVTPNDPLVIKHVKQAGLNITGKKISKWVPLADPSNTGKINPEFLEQLDEDVTTESGTFLINFGGSARQMGMLPSYSKDYQWKKPDWYFSNGMQGDCTNITSAYLSIFRNLGIEAYGVDGYKVEGGKEGQDRHVWIELFLDNKAYYYDNDYGLIPLEEMKSRIYTLTGASGQSYMWNEKGQQPYVKNWWKSLIVTGAFVYLKPGEKYIDTANQLEVTLISVKRVPRSTWQSIMRSDERNLWRSEDGPEGYAVLRYKASLTTGDIFFYSLLGHLRSVFNNLMHNHSDASPCSIRDHYNLLPACPVTECRECTMEAVYPMPENFTEGIFGYMPDPMADQVIYWKLPIGDMPK
ncbi:MAG: hypothetical protein JXA01_10715 [Dehalococcoidia bacterium]|nr:hypothetical protein [Dehalococcoidia bacterium]